MSTWPDFCRLCKLAVSFTADKNLEEHYIYIASKKASSHCH